MINSLTEEQKARMTEFRDKWMSIGLSTERADHAAAEEGVREAYREAGLEPPKIVIWLDSPYAGAVGRAMLLELLKHLKVNRDSVGASVGASVWASVRASVGDSVGASVRASVGDSVWDSVGASVRASVGDSVWDSVGDSVWASVWASVRASVWDSVWASVWASVRASVGASVGDSVWASVGASVRASVGDSVGASVRASVGASVGASVRASVGDSVRSEIRNWYSGIVYGQHEAAWLAFYDYFLHVTDMTVCSRLRGLMAVAQNAGWWWPFEGAVILTERPVQLHRDERGRLHNLDGVAVLYPDGWGVYAVHGVRVPADIVTDHSLITVQRIEQEQNTEVRRVMMEIYGLDRYILDSGAQAIHTDDFGTLYRKDIPGDEPLVMVAVVNSTPEPDGSFKDYWLRVPPTCKTARQAVAWTFDLSEQSYAPLQQT